MQNGINIAPGRDTFVGINRKFTHHLESPYSDCQKDLITENVYLNKLFGYFISLGVNYYTQDFCFAICYQDQLLTACGCIDISTPRINSSRFCSTDKESKCLSSFKYIFQMSNIVATCFCPQQCEKMEYEISTSYAGFPSHNYLNYMATNSKTAKFFPKNVSFSDLTEFASFGFLRITIFYDNLFYTEYQDQVAKTVSTLTGEIGGQLGNSRLFIL